MQHCILSTPRVQGTARLPARRAASRCAALRPVARSQAAGSELQTAAVNLALTTAFLGVPAGLAWAEEAAPEAAAEAAAPAAAAVADAAATAAEAAGGDGIGKFVEIGFVLSPIVLYGLFWVYRDRVNPRAKLSDFLFICGAVIILGNIASIIIFRKRFF